MILTNCSKLFRTTDKKKQNIVFKYLTEKQNEKMHKIDHGSCKINNPVQYFD